MFDPKALQSNETFAFPLQCIWLKLNGSWPPDNPTRIISRFYNVWSLFVICLVGMTIYFQTAFLINTFGDILMVTENCCTTFMGFHNFLRLVHLRSNRTKLRTLCTDFAQNIWISEEEDSKIKAKCEREMIIFKIMSGMLFTLICMYCILPLIEVFSDLSSTEKPFPYKMVFFYPAQEGAYYVLTYIFTSLAGFAVVTTLFAEDSLFGFFVIYTCGKFAILHKNIRDITNHTENNDTTEQYHKIRRPESEISKKIKNEALGNVIKTHNILIKFCDNLESFYSPVLLVNFSISTILICMVGFQIVTVKMSMQDLVKFVLYITSVMSQLFILCWNGDNIISSSSQTAWELYACNWEGVAAKSKLLSPSNEIIEQGFGKDLILPILRAQQPLKITALKFSVLSLQSFTTILSTSMSYFTLLRTLFEDD